MLLAQRIQLYPTPEQVDYLDRCCGARRHAYNKLLEHFGQKGVKWSKKAAFEHFMKVIRPAFPWYGGISSRVTRNVLDDLDNAFRHFFRRVKLRQKPGFPKFHKKGINDGFAMRENLSGAKLGSANLSNADLSGADLSRANLSGAVLSYADLSGAKNLTLEQLDTACGNADTKLPEGLKVKDCPAAGMLPTPP